MHKKRLKQAEIEERWKTYFCSQIIFRSPYAKDLKGRIFHAPQLPVSMLRVYIQGAI
jgi:hypothetical protein